MKPFAVVRRPEFRRSVSAIKESSQPPPPNGQEITGRQKLVRIDRSINRGSSRGTKRLAFEG
jgi:hypothetical protein